ncbi:biotin transporter BioY [Microvirga antarctica]|uniref:biotin transporter BioY n=1 Tax=Microvirga antarctica TaxID=2819233 RepID=UPI001B304281|nr:biotin transporter BioY [Microvirga antarctica]
MNNGADSLPVSRTLLGLFWPARNDVGFLALRAMVLLALGSALLTVSAKTQVPLPFVPMTMQTMVVLLIGATYGSRLGAATIALYLLQGALGMPVFANTPPVIAGPGYFAGPTGGFLVGFLAAACVMGYMAERGWDRTLARVAVMMTLGHAVILLAGFGWLSVLLPVAEAWSVGIVPFIAATIVKTALAVALMQAAWSVIGRSKRTI